ncbi:hypothetical protein K440DRAFT_646054 [Wilcoxina mikolae CBS 423.85]|nr:hypothetical protein K440DRAFT_646054 [Wilcoxina mikolae CBS 423.85]
MQRRDGNASTGTKLLRYFARPRDERFADLKYTDFYPKFIHKPFLQDGILLENQWFEHPSPGINVPQVISARMRFDIICRLIFVSPCMGELFYLYALLLHKAAYSYAELRTVNGVTYTTFQEAATNIGLFDNITEAELCIQEAISLYYAPYHLRFLYAQMIVDISASALDLWERYKDNFSTNHA